MEALCVNPCQTAEACVLPAGWDNPTGMNGAGSSPSQPLFVSGAGDEAMVELDATASATPGEWVELFPADPARNGAAIQNKDAAAIVYLLEATVAPASGTQPGEIGVPVFPAYFNFDWTPRKRYFFRSTVASSKVAVKTW